MRWYFLFFFVSGFCSLVYEVVWLRLAMAQFGVNTPLVSVVLSVFMAGLGLGAWAAGRWTARLGETPSAPLAGYALAELAIAAAGWLVPSVLAVGHNLLVTAGGDAGWDSPSYFAAAAGWVTLALLPGCTAMGATLPLAMAAVASRFAAQARRSFSYLYLANVLGAVLGTAVPAFALIEWLGFRGTGRVAVALNLALAAGAFAWSRRADHRGAISPCPARETPGARGTPGSEPRWLAWLFATGFASLGLEVVWIRLYTPYLGTVIYAFAAILTLYLLGTWLGSRLYRATPAEWLESRAASAWFAAGVFAVFTFLAAEPRLGPPGFLRGTLRLLVGVAPFCAAVGFLTPMLVDRWSGGDPARAGRAYAVNVLGGILGPLVAGFLLLPHAGERWSVAVLALPLFFLGGKRSSARLAEVGLAAAALVLAHTYEQRFWPREVRRDSVATVTAVGQGMEKRLLVNGVSMTILDPVTKMMAHLPLAFHATPPERGLVIAFGMGTSFRSMHSWGIRVAAVELVPSVPQLFGYFHADGPALLGSPRARLVIDDGRRFLERTRDNFDVVTIDPPPPVEAAGSSLLYSLEFYAALQRRLRPGGIVQQWLPGGDRATRAAVATALAESFPHVRVFQYGDGLAYHFLASLEPLPATPAEVLAARLPPAAAADLVEWNPEVTAADRFRRVLVHEIPLESLRALAPRAPALADDRPVNEYYLLRRKLGVLTYENSNTR